MTEGCRMFRRASASISAAVSVFDCGVLSRLETGSRLDWLLEHQFRGVPNRIKYICIVLNLIGFQAEELLEPVLLLE